MEIKTILTLLVTMSIAIDSAYNIVKSNDATSICMNIILLSMSIALTLIKLRG